MLLTNMETLSKELSNQIAEYSNNMQNVYKNFEEYNISRKFNILIVFGDMITDMLRNKNFKLMIRLEMENYNIITEKQQKC